MEEVEGHSIESMEDNIDDVEELDMEDDDEPSPEEIGTTGFLPAREYQQWQKRPSYMNKPDVLGYLNSFKTLDDNDRARLCRSVATYLQNQINTRNGLYRRRSVGSRKAKEDLTRSGMWGPAEGHPTGKKLKRTRSVRDLSKALEDIPASAPE